MCFKRAPFPTPVGPGVTFLKLDRCWLPSHAQNVPFPLTRLRPCVGADGTPWVWVWSGHCAHASFLLLPPRPPRVAPRRASWAGCQAGAGRVYMICFARLVCAVVWFNLFVHPVRNNGALCR